ncbi:MAG: helix-turn-helix transcriptional regulator [Rhodoluna sp.]
MANEDSWKPAKTDKSERLFQLTCVLLYSERGLTKRELFHSVDAYRADLAGSNEDDFALNKKFERDKSELREMGIQVSNPDPKSDPDDMRYTIAADTFMWPDEIEFDAHQLQLLNLAAQVWAQASLSSDANRGLVRLRGLGIEPAAEDIIGFAPRLKTHEPSFLSLSNAIEERIEVSFDYRKPDGLVSKRHVQPWLLRNIDGQWLLICWDKDQKAARNFLLKRIVSKVILRSELISDKDVDFVRFEAPATATIGAAIADLERHTANQVATLRVKRDSQAWFHFHMDDQQGDSADVAINFMDIHLLAEELSEYALDIKVVSPAELDKVIRARFEAVASAHA